MSEYGERSDFDSAWIRQRHLEHGVGSAPPTPSSTRRATSGDRPGA
jgi:hypothetical protein